MDDLDLGATIKGFSPGQKIFGRYTLKAQLGRGGMGVVWRARDESLERDVAIKMLPEVVANDPSAVRDLKRETAKSQQLSHPHILRIYDFVEAGPLCGITMELVEGGTLTAKRLEQPGEVFTVAALQTWVGQLCEALEYAHSREKIVHRDLKPANLMLTADGQLKVADFGIAASVSDSVSRVSQQAGSSGTPVYMSPQQMMGEKPAVSDDIYALGATLYELLTGKPPFYSGNIIMQVQNKVPPPVTERRAELGVTGDPIPPVWEAAIAACLAKEPQDRPQSAGEVLERLGLAMRNTKDTKPEAKGERVVPQSPKAQAMDGSETNRPTSKTPLFVGIFAGVVLLCGLGWYFGMHAPEQRRMETERQRAEQVRAAEEAERQRLAAARGGIVVRTDPPGAEVRVGAVALDRSPLNLKDQRLGKYPLRIRLDGYEDWDGEVEVKENEFAEVNVALVRSTGAVELTSIPSGAQVSREGRVLGRTPLRLSEVPTGKAVYEFTLENYSAATSEGVVQRGGTVAVAAKLAALPRFVGLDPQGRLIPLGHDGSRGQPIGTERWDGFGPYTAELFAVQRQGKWGLIDWSGRLVVEPRWEQIGFPSGGRAVVRQSEGQATRWGYIDLEGRLVVPPVWNATFGYTEGMAAVNRSDKWGFIDLQGRVVVEPQWDNYAFFSEGLAAVTVREKGKARDVFIDQSGRTVLSPSVASLGMFRQGLASFMSAEGKMGFMDRGGRVVIEPQWAHTRIGFLDDRAVVSRLPEQGGGEVLIDRQGKLVSNQIWRQILDYFMTDGMAPVESSDGKWGYISWSDGRAVIEPQWDGVQSFSQDRAAVRNHAGLWGAIDKSGRLVIEPQWDASFFFSEAGFAVVKRAGKHGVIDRDGKIVVEPVWSYLTDIPKAKSD